MKNLHYFDYCYTFKQAIFIVSYVCKVNQGNGFGVSGATNWSSKVSFLENLPK